MSDADTIMTAEEMVAVIRRGHSDGFAFDDEYCERMLKAYGDCKDAEGYARGMNRATSIMDGMVDVIRHG